MAMRWEYTKNGEKSRMKTAKKAVADFIADHLEYEGSTLFTVDDVYIVWFCKVLDDWKALISTDRINTGLYFEVTYNGVDDEIYLDYYTKVYNRAITMLEN
jgi:hypothetical protein